MCCVLTCRRATCPRAHVLVVPRGGCSRACRAHVLVVLTCSSCSRARRGSHPTVKTSTSHVARAREHVGRKARQPVRRSHVQHVSTQRVARRTLQEPSIK